MGTPPVSRPRQGDTTRKIAALDFQRHARGMLGEITGDIGTVVSDQHELAVLELHD